MISIAMTTYNGERFLEEQLRSLTEQTTLPNELVVCDDGSTDRTGNPGAVRQARIVSGQDRH
jgi:glycosyltransferase involved in cell wall biosynthesis